ncbi:MAG TPA: hypothetical protein PKX92_03050 [Edaphocola sp.]|nr:hypothetical protein [Edaphocola sp.]
MKHTKEQVIEKAKKILTELNYDWYFENTIKIFNSENKEYYFEEYGGGEKWCFIANAPSEQFANRNDAIIGLIINDDTLDPFIVFDTACGRSFDLKVSQKNGKYFIDGVWEGV